MYQVEVYLRVKGDRMSGQWGVNGQHKRPVELVSINVIFPPMENVTLNPKEQARLKVLNSLLAEQMTVDQAAGLMGVSTRHTRRMLAAYRKEGAHSLTAIVVVGRPMQHRRQPEPRCCTWPAPATSEPTTPT